MTKSPEGIRITREEFAKDPQRYYREARPGCSVTITDASGNPRMKLNVPPTCESVAHSLDGAR